MLQNDSKFVIAPSTRISPLSPKCTCYRYCQYRCNHDAASRCSLRCSIPLRSEKQVTFKTSLQPKQVVGAADVAFYLAKMYEPVCLVCVSKKKKIKKKEKKEIESGQQRLDDCCAPFSPHTHPGISDTGRHFSALHT